MRTPVDVYLDYPGIRVTDLDRSLRFYTRALGLTELRRGTMDHGGVWVLMKDRRSRQHLELNWYPPGSKYASKYSVGEGLDHLGFRVARMAPAIRRLRRAGASLVDQIRDGKVVEVAYMTDPDGLWIELIRTPGA
ncbi:MAG TPA: VOC family protein [Thermoplasmata archaeon]|nr:VOC family protein [Thermoplasmata archaeon]